MTLALTVNPEDLFYLKGNALMVKKGLDYEVMMVAFKPVVQSAVDTE